VSDLVTFLRARLDEDEAAARLATPGPWHCGDGGWIVPVARADIYASQQNAAHIARHGPARVLADVAAKRALIADLEDLEEMIHSDRGIGRFTFSGDTTGLRYLAAVYAGHPDYDEGWKL
jgi:hypothetical protein